MMAATTGIILAAGLSRRFGTDDKLLQDLHGMPVAEHIARTLLGVPLQRQMAVCSNGQVAKLYADLGYEVILNALPHVGMGHSLQLAIKAVTQTDFVLVCLADMPFVTETHLTALFDGLAETSADFVASSLGPYLGPPALMSRAAIKDRRFEGDTGARNMLGTALRVPIPERQLLDIDTMAALEVARKMTT